MFLANKYLVILISITFVISVADVAWSGDCMPAAHEKCSTSYYISSRNMVPTLVVGDYISVDTQRYITQWPEMGDVVIFLLPTNSEITYIMRIVGLPGDRIQIRNGVTFINDEPVKKVRIQDYVANDPKGEGGGNPIQQYEETQPNGVKYRVLDQKPNGSADNTDEYIVPARHYFLMGDNRDNSEDSRFLDAVGYVPRDSIVSKATSIYFSWNLSRIGQKIE